MCEFKFVQLIIASDFSAAQLHNVYITSLDQELGAFFYKWPNCKSLQLQRQRSHCHIVLVYSTTGCSQICPAHCRDCLWTAQWIHLFLLDICFFFASVSKKVFSLLSFDWLLSVLSSIIPLTKKFLSYYQKNRLPSGYVPLICRIVNTQTLFWGTF